MSRGARREHLRPLELLLIAAGCGLFAGAIVLLATRQLLLSGEVALGAFILALVGLAMLDLAISPKTEPHGLAKEPDAPAPSPEDGAGDEPGGPTT